MFCNKCGKQIDETAKFCGNCGAKLTGEKNTKAKSETKKDKEDEKWLEYMSKIEENTRRYLEPKDGNKHILLMHSHIDRKDINEEYDTIYNPKVNNTLRIIQDSGMEIIDIKITSTQVSAGIYHMQTLIIYK